MQIALEKDYLASIASFLDNTVEMKPVPTLLKPFIKKDPNIKALLFDVYGTLLISSSEDIEESDICADNLVTAFDTAGIALVAEKDNIPGMLNEILDDFKESIMDSLETAYNENRPFPEVNLLVIWEKIITERFLRGNLRLSGPLCIKCFTFVFEILSNRIYPMPGLKELVKSLVDKKYPLGIISNAQFYTPVVMNYFLHDFISESEEVLPFDPELTVFSYKYLRSKPDPLLFEGVRNQLREKHQISPDEVLFIGNDMFRDIYPAQIAGFKTALFAGDTKSLRLRQRKLELKNVLPDYIITDLLQLLHIVD
jgi:putative hydrolase of the HAD superfamily